jgi:SAM-dependent methyltransferase
VDFLPRNIERARACARQAGAGEGEGVQFVCADVYRWVPEGKYDVLLSFDALEHIDAPEAFLRKMTDFIAPGGVAVLAFGPLFHSPFGDHMWDFFRLQIPWRGVLFSEEALLRVRRECFRPTDPADSYRKVAGGLNLIRYSEFLEHVRDTGWEFDYLAVNTFLKRLPPLRMVSDAITRLPWLRDYFAHNVYAVLRRATDADAGTSLSSGR